MKKQTEAEIRSQLASRVGALRRARKWTQQVLADRAELPRGYVADIEGSRRNPSLHTLLRIANALGVPVRTLFGEPEADAEDSTPP